jgi:hypothetical protein
MHQKISIVPIMLIENVNSKTILKPKQPRIFIAQTTTTKHFRSFAGNISSLSRCGRHLPTRKNSKMLEHTKPSYMAEKKITEIKRMKEIYKVGSRIQEDREFAETATPMNFESSSMKDTLQWLESLDADSIES